MKRLIRRFKFWLRGDGFCTLETNSGHDFSPTEESRKIMECKHCGLKVYYCPFHAGFVKL